MAFNNDGHQHPQTADTLTNDTNNDSHDTQKQPECGLEAAFVAAYLGFPVFPCNPVNKRPLINGWPNYATKNVQTIADWWILHPNAMVGAVTGAPSGKFVIDIDVTDGVDARTKMANLEAKYGAIKPVWRVRTPSGGMHLYCDMPDGKDIRNSASRIAAGVDIRGTGGYVIFPGSQRADGVKYLFVTEGEV